MIQSDKLFNDPVHGFIEVPRGLILDVINHPFFQRLRRINQLGFSHLVYPGALHTRFHHALGAMHLTRMALDTLREKGTKISDKEYEAALLAILLHDIGHGPFSHVLEFSFMPGISHEQIGLALMNLLNDKFKGRLDLAMRIYCGTYNRRFLHDLVSSQLDMDRMDYLLRDSYFTGVAEGIIGVERIIRTLNVKHDRLVIEEKGIYPVENFIIARRMMYWQVYLHKTVVAAQFILLKLLERARSLNTLEPLSMPDPLDFFFSEYPPTKKLTEDMLHNFILVDDMDIIGCLKTWKDHTDPVLSEFSGRLLNRNLFRVSIQSRPFSRKQVLARKRKFTKIFARANIPAHYYISTGVLKNETYSLQGDEQIKILHPDGNIRSLVKTSDRLNFGLLSDPPEKYYLCYPKELD